MTATFEADTYDPTAQNTSFDLIESVILNDPEIFDIHKRATEEEWFRYPEGRARYKAEIQQTRWYQENNQYARDAITKYKLAQDGKGADWRMLLENARLAIQQRAAELGSELTPERLKQLEGQFVYGGWGAPGRTALLDRALSETVQYQQTPLGNKALRGQAGEVAQSLRQIAVNNGITYDDSFYQQAAQSVAFGLTSTEDWQRDIQEQAASMWPVFADKIRAGVSARSLASPYITTMAEEFEINPNDINLSDPYIRSALGGFSQDGNPEAMNLWDFQKKLRQDPRWMNTSKAQNEITSVTGRVMQMFGLMGG